MNLSEAPYFIAEVSSNHNRDLERAKRFIRGAKKSGFSAVKFQHFKIETLFSAEILEKSAEHRRRIEFELPDEFIAVLKQEAELEGIDFGMTFFDLEGLEKFGGMVDFIKIASFELLWLELFTKVSRYNVPTIVSTGMANLEEIRRAIDVLSANSLTKPIILHCLSSYPAPFEETNLSAIETIRESTGLMVGWSDHSSDPAVISRAVHRWNARVLEMHVDIDGNGLESDSGHCWTFDAAAQVISEIGRGFECDGSGLKVPAPSEIEEAKWRADPSDGLRPLLETRANWTPPS